MRIKIEGSIAETNASFINEKKNGVTIVKIDFEKLVANADKAQRDALMDQIGDMEQVYKLCRNMNGMIVQKRDTLTIKYR